MGTAVTAVTPASTVEPDNKTCRECCQYGLQYGLRPVFAMDMRDFSSGVLPLSCIMIAIGSHPSN